MPLRLAVPGQTIEVNVGDTVRVQFTFTYQGPAWRETFYCALSRGHDEVSGGAGSQGWDIPAKTTPTTITGCYVDVPIPNRPGETFDLLGKMGNILAPLATNAVKVLGAAVPIVTNFRIASYAKL